MTDAALDGRALSFHQKMEYYERSLIMKEFERHQGNYRKTAYALNMALRTLFYKVKRFGLKEWRRQLERGRMP
jgi:transcriptional regulator with PAS, ATPase and Fis domain